MRRHRVSDEDYARAMVAERRLRPVERMVQTLCAIAPTDEPMCVGCVWELILKPLVTPLVGWDRGDLPKQAADPDPDGGSSWKPVDLDEARARRDRRPAPETETEKWLRSSEAYDVVTDRWLSWLESADPGLGHGLPRPGWAREAADA